MEPKGFTQIKNGLIRSDKLTTNDKVVLFVLLSFGDCKEIFVSQKKIAEYANVSRASVVRSIENLRKLKLLKTALKIKTDRSTLIYKLNTEEVVAQSNRVVSESNKGCCTEQQGVVAQSNTSNKSISNKRIEIKDNDVLPDWLDKEAWSEWVQYRKEIKKRLTPSTIKIQLKKLEKHKECHVSIIELAIEKGWQGLVFEDKYSTKPKEDNYRFGNKL